MQPTARDLTEAVSRRPRIREQCRSRADEGVAFIAVRWTEEMIVAALRDWVDRYEQVPLRVDWDRGMAKRRGHTDKLERLNAHPSRVPSPTAVLARFGSWQAALSAAGYQARYVPRPNRIGAEGLQQTAALYASGRSTRELARHFGVAPKTIRDRLQRTGAPLRPPRAREIPAAVRAEILSAAREGATQQTIATRVGCSRRAARSVLIDNDATGGRLARRLRPELVAINAMALTDRQRAAVELAVARCLTLDEAGAQLGIAGPTVWGHLCRVADRLERETQRATSSPEVEAED
jgi:DNA-directed RNA polymerase specialized sigma24 family protein